ncbi:hypothetical protein [Actinomadura hibisca]|uniref:hypothetical protein n=1 Tax=Actinomadura hibisca TaxID=68565 RepID=UPI0012FAB469|nr:hypothetical protein [Actinomadura hibisca]
MGIEEAMNRMKQVKRAALIALVGASTFGAGIATAATSGAAPHAAPTKVSAQASSAKPGTAVNLNFSESLRESLGDIYFNKSYKPAHKKAIRGNLIGPWNVYYGKVAGKSAASDVYYAVGTVMYDGDPLGTEGGPHVWRKKGGGAWTYVGNTGGAVCEQVPSVLVKAWHKPCNW